MSMAEPSSATLVENAGQEAVTAETEAPPRSSGGGRGWTTRRWLQVGVATALAILIVLSLLGTWVFAHGGQVTNRLVDRDSPALIASVRFEAAMLNQETGIRGYGLTSRPDFLQPYTEGLAQEHAALAALRPLVNTARERADLSLVTQRAQIWQTQIASPVANAHGTAAVALATRNGTAGKGDFDRLRAAMTTQQQHLQQARQAAQTELTTVRNQRDVVFGIIAGVIALLAVLIFVGLRRGVTGPLERLAADTGQVADGDFTHPISVHGPADLQQVADSVEEMRQQLTEALSYSNDAREKLADQAEDLQRSNSELEQFAYVASHDLQEPLRKVASFCQLLELRYADQLDERAGKYIAFAVDGANRMQTLINDLLQFSRVGRLHEMHPEVDLEDVFTTTVDALGVPIEESAAEVTHDPLPTIPGDPTQLGMLVQNLLSNAIKFRSPDRPPRIHVSATRDGAQWQLAVTDNGIGIDAEYAERVFVIFQRLHTRDTYPGNGIGLAMCKKIVEFHGGTITIDTTHTPGTRIAFTLPAEPDPQPIDPAT
jgi:signal transduction histidine kinase